MESEKDEKPRRDKALSEKKRQEGLLARQEDFAKKRNQLKISLSAKPPTKKLTFDSDDEAPSKSSLDNPSRKKKNLFGEEQTENTVNEENEFVKAIERRKGQSEEARILESNFQGDARFNLDDRFEDDQHAKKNKIRKKHASSKSQEQIEADAEKEGDYKILENILGKRVARRGDGFDSDDDSRKKKHLGKLTRFDPTNPAHSQFEVNHEDSSSDDEQVNTIQTHSDEAEGDGSVNEMEKNNKTTALKTKTFMDRSFAETLRNNLKTESETKSSFSLMASLGLSAGAEVINDSEPSTSQVHIRDIPASQTKQPANRGTQKKDVKGQKHEPFFFTANDQRLVKGVQKFCCSESMEKVMQRWSKSRPKLVNSFKSQRKIALRQHENRRKKGKRSGTKIEPRTNNKGIET